MKRLLRINFLFFSLCLVSCQIPTSEVWRTPVLEVYGKFLYQDELQNIVPQNVTAEDSVRLVDNFIKKWTTDVLLYESARKNIPNEKEIEALVETYRKSLTIHNYLQVLVNQRMPKPTDAEIATFFESHKNDFRLTECVVKGSFLKVQKNAPKLDKVRKALKQNDQKSLEFLDKYTLQHAAQYDYFCENWIVFSEFQKKWPNAVASPESFLKNGNFHEFADSEFIYMVNFADYRTTGDESPLEFAKERIRDILFKYKKNEFIQHTENDIFENAVENGTVTFF